MLDTKLLWYEFSQIGYVKYLNMMNNDNNTIWKKINQRNSKNDIDTAPRGKCLINIDGY
jgi:hypothetical protein